MRYSLLTTAALLLSAACSEAPRDDTPANVETAAVEPAAPSVGADSSEEATVDAPQSPTNSTSASDEGQPDADAAEQAEGEAGQTEGGDGSSLVLAPLRAADVSDLPGELACSFRMADEERPILIGRADVRSDARAVAAVRIGDYVERLVSRTEGGFGAMERGLSFGGRGLTATIEPGALQSGGGEAVTHRATLLAQRADGAERRFPGLWTCGP